MNKLMKHILIVEDEREVARFLERLFRLKGYETTHIESGRRFDQMSDYSSFQLAFIDIRLPDRNGLDILHDLKKKAPHCSCIIMTGYSTVKTAVEAIKKGAADFIEKPFEDIEAIEQLADRLLKNSFLSSKEAGYAVLAEQLGCFLGTNPQMHELYQFAYKIASKNITILIEGETGTGKEVLANYIHAASERKDKPFVGINCGAISESLLESELFGHVKGAFTGAAAERVGYFEAASSGTLFLDEIAEATPATQVKLLRVLETGEFMKIGGTVPRRTTARIIAASHVNLEKAVRQNSFREDLLYRLDVVKLTIPPLRERREDIPFLIQSLIQQTNEKIVFAEETIEQMVRYDWPGNMRELANVIRRTAALAHEGMIIPPHLLPGKVNGQHPAVQTAALNTQGDFLNDWRQLSRKVEHLYKGEQTVQLNELLQTIKKMEKDLIVAVIHSTLKETAGNREQAASRLGLSKRQIRYYLNEK